MVDPVQPNATTSMLQENSITWDLIAESSKNETPEVYAMILNAFGTLDSAASSSGEQPPQSNMKSSYLSYPKEDLEQLLEDLKVRRVFKACDIDVSGVSKESAGGSDAPNTKPKHKKNKKKQKPSARETIRKQQIKELANQSNCFFDKKDRHRLQDNFKCRVVEMIAFYYVYVSYYAFKDKQPHTFIDALLSLRDALQCFVNTMDVDVATLCKGYLDNMKLVFPWKSFLQNHIHVLIKTHFKRKFQKALKPFPEQQELIETVHASPHHLFVLPWGVGTGKTAMLPALSAFYHERAHQTLYCVPFGPVRDQSAALLYRCGIPFAYVVKTSGTFKEQYELQPSFHCSDGKPPQVLIVDPEFVKYYTLYWQVFELSECYDLLEHPPDIYLPVNKKRYAHLTHLMWNTQFVLLLDEPCEDDGNVHWVLNHLPETSFVMSATSWNLVTDQVKALYTQRTAKETKTIVARTIGVSTTLVGYWLQDNPVLSPFQGIRTKAEFVQKYEYVCDKVLWKRFLSANVLLDWASKLKHFASTHMKFSISFDLQRITFDCICERVLSYCKQMIDNPNCDDAFFASFFAFGDTKKFRGGDFHTEFIHMLTTESGQYMGGCIIGTPTVKSTYNMMQPLLRDFPSLDEMQQQIDLYRKSIVSQYNEVKKIPVQKREDVERKRDKIREIENKRNSSLPIHESQVLNTPEYIQRYRQTLPVSSKPSQYLRVQSLIESGDPSKGLDDWHLELDTMQGSFWRDNEEALKWRWKGVGSIMDHKEFNMKNINDLENGYIGFMLLDKLGAQGLNLKIRHGWLMRGEDGSMLSPSTCLQVAGRVGRWGQDDTGFVFLTEEELFWRVFG